ncbi:MAG: hypothetical protein M9924_19850 [Rhizobiaceae bacterium]|nr:hypothetical protein [Rhizobiaceae bacterium]
MDRIAGAAAMLAATHARESFPCLPDELSPRTLAEALAIQDEIVRRGGETPTAWKVATLPEGVAWGAILPGRIFTSGSAARIGDEPVGIEAELAFRFRRNVARSEYPLGRDALCEAIDAFLAMELVTSRFNSYQSAPPLHRVADFMSNGGLVLGPQWKAWRSADLSSVEVTLSIEGIPKTSSQAGHPSGDPLLPLLAYVNDRLPGQDISEGTLVITGSLTGLTWTRVPATAEAHFHGLGTVGVTLRAF